MLLRLSVLATLLLAVFMVACGGDEADGATLEEAIFGITATPETAETQVTEENKATATRPAPETTVAPPTRTTEPEPTATEAPAVTQEAPRPTEVPQPAGPPDSGRWIDVNVSNYSVTFMDGQSVLQTIGPVGVGREVDTGVWESTRTGLFYVSSFNEALVYDAPYDTYISHWVGFDDEWANGFHSFLKDEEGNVVDASTGNVSNGCIRTGDPEAIYAFAEPGMPVWVHF